MRETLFGIINALMVVWALTIWPITLWSLLQCPRWRRSATYLAVLPPAIWWLAWL